MKTRRADNAPALLIDMNWPDKVRVYGIPVKLQPKQWDLLVLLASRPGRFCRYELIYKTLWPDSIVENNQMHFQKSRLKAKLEAALRGRARLLSSRTRPDGSTGVSPSPVEWIITLPRRGFVLNLKASQILIRPYR